jgi:hypothetical protein
MRCNHCKGTIKSPSPEECTAAELTPLEVTIRDPDTAGQLEVCFCSWTCLSFWANVQAGEPLMPDLDSEYFRAGGMA